MSEQKEISSVAKYKVGDKFTHVTNDQSIEILLRQISSYNSKLDIVYFLKIIDTKISRYPFTDTVSEHTIDVRLANNSWKPVDIKDTFPMKSSKEQKEIKPIEIFTSLDLEMAQPSGKIIQIGACVGNIATGEILEKLSVFINPHEQLSPFIMELTGISQEEVDGGVSLLEGYDQLKTLHKKYKSFFNPIVWGGGDSKELLEQLKKEDPNFQGWCFGRRWIDVKTLFVSWRIANGQPIQGGLAKSMTKVGIAFEGKKHNGMDDAINTFRVFCKMLECFKGKEYEKEHLKKQQKV